MTSEPRRHREPDDLADRFALGVTRLLRFLADTFFARRYGHRAIVLETVAAVPGMVGAMATHLQCLRRLVDGHAMRRLQLLPATDQGVGLVADDGDGLEASRRFQPEKPEDMAAQEDAKLVTDI